MNLVRAVSRIDSIMFLIAGAVMVSFLDAILTLTVVQMSIADEANPMMRAVVMSAPVLFVSIKVMLPLGLLTLGAWLLPTPVARGLCLLAIIMYGGVSCYTSLLTLIHLTI